MAALVGADVQRLRDLADRFAQQAGILREAAGAVSGQMQTTTWAGPDAEDFGARWETVDRASMVACADALEEGARALRANADQQEAASAADGGGVHAVADAPSTAAAGLGVGGPVGAGPALGVGGPAGAAVSGEADIPAAAKGFIDGVDDMTPQEVHDAWEVLDPETQDWLTLHRPYLIGNLDGIPFETRSKCNESEVVRLWNEYDRERKAIKAENPAYTALEVDFTAALYLGLTQDQLGALKHIHSEFPGPGAKRADAFRRTPVQHLVAFDLTGGDAPRAAVAFGDLDTAENIGVYVPGMGSKVNKGLFHTHIGNAEDLYRVTSDIVLRSGGGDENGDPHVATVYWLGYDAPEGLASAAGWASSSEGAELFAGFADGMEAVNPDARKTAAGHSYGSIVATQGAEQTNAIDSLVVFGSPGLGFSPHPNVPKDERYYGTADKDPWADRGLKGGTPGGFDFTQLPTWKTQGYSESVGHSEYLHHGMSFQQSLAAVIADHKEEIPHR